MSEFVSKYGVDSAGRPEGCPAGMYPWDTDYEGELISSFAEFKDYAEQSQNSLNLPISWYFDPADEGGVFSLVFVMPRKYGKTFSLRLAPGFDRTEVEQWLEDWTKKVAAGHFGWTEAVR